MEVARFDTLVRSLPTVGSRRQTLAGLLMAAIGLRGVTDLARVDAHDALNECREIKDPKRARVCVRRARKHKHQHCRRCPRPANPCQVATCSSRGTCGVANRPRGFSCEDGLFCNGAETCDGHGNCLPGTPPSCDDGHCTTHDYCDEASRSCVHQELEVCI